MIRVFKGAKKKDSSSPSFVAADAEDFRKVHKSEIINVGISSTGKFIFSASKDTTIIIWSLKGHYHNNHHIQSFTQLWCP